MPSTQLIVLYNDVYRRLWDVWLWNCWLRFWNGQEIMLLLLLLLLLSLLSSTL